MTTSVAPEPGDITVAGPGASAVTGIAVDAGIAVDRGVAVDVVDRGVAVGRRDGGIAVHAGIAVDALDAGVAVDAGPLVDLAADRRAPGRPRSARADEAIVEALLDLIAEGTTLEALSMEAVATRAGVGKATIYRRWANKEALLLSALTALKGPMPEVSGESLREDLLALLRPIAAARMTRAGRIMPCLIPELQRNAELAEKYWQLTEPRRELMRDVLRRGMERGELRAGLDVNATVAMLTGPIVAQSMLSPFPVVDLTKLPEQIVDTMLPGLLA
jgi:AcrR family transcriptional regulator